MATDGNLRSLFRRHLPQFHWVSVETGASASGIPDLNYCHDAIEGWVELKVTSTSRIPTLTTEQTAWLGRRARAGGRCFLATRFTHAGGPRLGAPVDDLFLHRGADAESVLLRGLRGAAPPVLRLSGGPGRGWDWGALARALCDVATEPC